MSETSQWPEGLPQFRQERRSEVMPKPDGVQMETGRIRLRPTHTTSLEMIDVVWTFVFDEYEDFEEYFHTELANGSLPFQMDHYTAHEHLGLAYAVTKAYAFLDSNYQFSRADNEFNVMATLLATDISSQVVLSPADWQDPPSGVEPWDGAQLGPPWTGNGPVLFLPELELTMGPCGSSLTLCWSDPGPSDSIVIQVETDVDSEVYETLMTLDPKPTSCVSLPNAFGGHKLRARFVIGPLSSPWSEVVTTALADVDPPTISSFAGATESDVPPPGTWFDNDDAPLIAPLGSVARADFRYQYNPQEATSPPTFTLPPGTELRITSDGSNPTADSPSVGQDPNDSSFAGVYKAAAYDPATGCLSPPITIVADRVMELTLLGDMTGIGGTSTSGCTGPFYSRYPTPEFPGGWDTPPYYHGDACVVLAGSPQGHTEHVLAAAKINAQEAVDAGASPIVVAVDRPLMRRVLVTPMVPTPDPETYPYADWGGGVQTSEATWGIYTGFHFGVGINLDELPRGLTGSASLTYGDSVGSVSVPYDEGGGGIEGAIDSLWATTVGPNTFGQYLTSEFRLTPLPPPINEGGDTP